jgi:hypothetical protein
MRTVQWKRSRGRGDERSRATELLTRVCTVACAFLAPAATTARAVGSFLTLHMVHGSLLLCALPRCRGRRDVRAFAEGVMALREEDVMNTLHRCRRVVSGSTARRMAAVGAAGTATLLLTLGVGVGASGAAGAFGPHDPHVQQHVTSPSVAHPHAVAPLSQANFVVTDLASGVGTVYQWSTVAPVYNSICNASTTSDLCLTYGSGTSPDGGSLNLSPQAQPWTAGAFYDSIGGPSSFSVGGNSCGSVGPTASEAVSSGIELDQYAFTSGSTPLQSVALQIECTTATTDITGTIAYNIVPTDPADGYYIFGQGGELTGFGNDNYLVYLNGAMYYNINAPIVGMTPTPDGAGYWMVGSDGGVYASGDAGFYGSTGNLHLNKPIVGMAATPDGKGYWFVGSDGGIFAYGDALFYGSTGSIHLNKPIVGMAATPSGHGYWLVASDGGIFAFGDAQFYGSTGSIHLNKPVVGMAPTPSGHGYWFVASDGGIFAYGDAQFYGSTGNLKLNEPIVGMTPTPDGTGYWFTASDGGVFNYGSAGFDGSLGGLGITDVAGMSLGM